ncbi:hypothetical protein EASAB2608_07938 [Streptomyces sp. EAS-AB2608]|uniref:hypothetical protein n=1 Tax=Streptomyces sp. EAS-AB2608 TaxID=2779671 RepID=UPI00073DD87A|nr:hypothetical protein [Streptomyces sp. EAS-AB2608]BCM72604.1 hypothetical protein EASAB2608_07938 [Streptomyces sp. EAS-AB2608]CUW26065.1 hypothetical protein TUE45_00775 [Streptomyces reticuli]
MCPTQAKEHHPAAAPPAPRPVPQPGSPVRTRPYGGTGAARCTPGRTPGAARCAAPPGATAARAADADVPAGRVHGHVPGDRGSRARALDAPFAGEAAGRAARFPRAAGTHPPSRHPWRTPPARGGTGETAVSRTGALLGLSSVSRTGAPPGLSPAPALAHRGLRAAAPSPVTRGAKESGR